MKRASEDSQDNTERTKSDEKDKQINPRILTNPKQNIRKIMPRHAIIQQ